MNKGIYRLVWNSGLGALQVVSEAAKSKSCGGSGTRLAGGRGKAAVWPLALLSLGIASSAWAGAPINITSNADSGTGSLREQLSIGGTLRVDPSVNTINLGSDATINSGLTTLTVTAPLTVTGANLVGNNGSLGLSGTSGGIITTAIAGQFTGAAGSGGPSFPGAVGAAGSNVSSGTGGVGGTGSTGQYSTPNNASAAVNGSFFTLTNNATLTGGQGVASVPGNGGNGGVGGSTSLASGNTGGSGGTGGAGANGGAGSAGGAGISGSFFTVTNNASIIGGNGATGATGATGGQGGAGSSSGKYGGSGGNGGRGGNGGNGGLGGAGISGFNIQVINTGTIQGGNGGIAGAAGVGGAGGARGTGFNLVGTAGVAGANGVAGFAGVGGAGVVVTGNSTVFNAGTISGGFANDGSGARANAIELSGGGNQLTLAAGSVINGNVVSSSGGSDVLALGGDSNTGSTTFDLASTGPQGSPLQQYQGFGSFEKIGNSTWTLTGTDTYGQNWAVNNGTLVMASGASLLGSVAVASGATLNTSDASIAGGVSNAGALVIGSAATPFSTLSVGNTFSQSSSGTLQVSALSSSQYSKLSVNGNVALAGTLNVDVKSGNTLAAGNQLTHVISATGTVTGQFSHVTDNSLLFDFTPTYNSSSVDLNVVATSGSANTVLGSVQALGNSPALGAAAALDQIIASDPNGKLASHFVALSNQGEVSKAASEVLPLMTGGSTTAARAALSSINGVVQARSESVLGGQSSGDSGQSSGDSGLSSGESVTEQHLWIKPFGSWANQASHDGVAGVNSSVGGMAFGLDANLNDRWMLGTAFIYAKADTHNSGDTASQQLTTDVYQLVGYGAYHLDDTTDLSFQLDGGQNHNDGKRNLDFAGLQAKSNYDSWTAHAGVALERTFSLTPATRFTPSVRADYTWIKDEAYNEKGADELDLQVKSRSTNQFILGVDGKLAHDLTQQLTLSGKLGVGYDLLASRDSLTSSFAGAPGTVFTTYSSSPQRWLARGGTELSYAVNGQLQLAVRYDVEERSHFVNQTASAQARWAF
ncbi:autotransporter domain-containing protein [Pseudomonas sp. MWU12-2037]|uniref:autotransporter domain-containing protein n=1 Tax=Pseudomonas sp. MWU12-2037 TaxID=2928690 RepID=UPI00200FAA38|nr:autotransporter domain-containing protein [Pseudomonas sp. MWU12-2037]